MLALAIFHAFAPAELMGISDAAHELGVARPTIYWWIDDRTLDSVPHGWRSGCIATVELTGRDSIRKMARSVPRSP